MEPMKLKYLERMSELYPTIAKASTEIINLQAISNLPKGTEHYITDIHGEYGGLFPCAQKRLRLCAEED